MKQLAVPKGQTLKQAEVTADVITVDGTLLVSGDVKADEIRGSGSIVAENITAHTCRVRYPAARNTIRANRVRAQRIDAKYADIRESLWATVCAVIPYLRARRVAAALLCAEHLDVQDCVIVPQREYGAVRFALTVFIARRRLGRLKRRGRTRNADKTDAVFSRLRELDGRMNRLERELSCLQMQTEPEAGECELLSVFPDAA